MGDKHIPQIKETQPGDERPHWGMCLLEAAGIVAGSHAQELASYFANSQRTDLIGHNAVHVMNMRGGDNAIADAYADYV